MDEQDFRICNLRHPAAPQGYSFFTLICKRAHCVTRIPSQMLQQQRREREMRRQQEREQRRREQEEKRRIEEMERRRKEEEERRRAEEEKRRADREQVRREEKKKTPGRMQDFQERWPFSDGGCHVLCLTDRSTSAVSWRRSRGTWRSCSSSCCTNRPCCW